MIRKPPQSEPKAHRWWLSGANIALVLGIILPLLLAPVGAILLISIIGIPLFFAMAMLPTVCLILLPGNLLGRFLRKGAWGYIAGSALMVATLCLVPFVLNQRIDSTVQALIRDDTGTATPPPRGSTIGILRRGSPDIKSERLFCDDLCRRLLLEGAAGSVLVAYKKDGGLVPDPAAPALVYRLEAGSNCAPLPQAYSQSSDGLARLVGPDSLERLNLELAMGLCLTARPARLGEADSVLAYGRLADDKDRRESGLDLGDGIGSVNRISLWSKRAGQYIETYRYTYVHYSTLFPVLAPTIVEGRGMLEMKAGFARFEHAARPRDKNFHQVQLSQHLKGWFSPALAGDEGPQSYKSAPETDATTMSVLRQALTSREAPTPTQLAVAKAFSDGLMQRRDLSARETELLRDLTLDRRFPVTSPAIPYANNKLSFTAKDWSRVADGMFQRLRDSDRALMPDNRMSDTTSSDLSMIGQMIAHLPDADIARHRSDLVWLSRNRSLRAPAYVALRRLADEGPVAGQHYLYLIDDSQMFPSGGSGDRNRNSDPRFHQHPYLAGIKGLCEMGSDAAPYLPELLKRLKDGRVNRNGSYGDIAFNTLVGMGAPFEVVEAQFKGASQFVTTKYSRSTLNRERQSRDVEKPIRPAFERATRKVDCTY